MANLVKASCPFACRASRFAMKFTAEEFMPCVWNILKPDWELSQKQQKASIFFKIYQKYQKEQLSNGVPYVMIVPPVRRTLAGLLFGHPSKYLHTKMSHL